MRTRQDNIPHLLRKKSERPLPAADQVCMICGMAKKSVKRICLLFKNNNRSDRDRLSGIYRFAASRADWEVRALDRSSSSFASEATRVRQGWKPDGVIYTADNDYLSALRLIGALQAVRAEMDPPDSAGDDGADISVRANAKAIMSDIVSLLTRRGYRNFAFYGTEDPSESAYSEMCERHFLLALRKNKDKVGVFRESAGDTWSLRIQNAARWVEELPKPCAVLAYTDELARNLLDACREAHANVPEQVAILGIDDAPDVCETCRPTLSSVRLDFEMSGYLAAQALDRVLRKGRNESCRHVSYGIQAIVERQSTQDVRGCGRIVNAAMEILRTLPLERLSVDEIVTRSHVSRRLLEINFKKVLGHGIHELILRRRLDTLHEKLKKTSIPVGELSMSCGFKTAAAARIAYRKRFGKPMTEARRQGSPADGK